MIKLFITDIDGCLTTPFTEPDWELISQIRRLNKQSQHDIAVPPLSICSGRPMSYVEAVAQWLGVRHPVAFENAGIYKLKTNEVQFLSEFDTEAEQNVDELKAWMKDTIVPMHDGLTMEFTKRMHVGVIHLDKDVIDKIYTPINKYVQEHFPRFEVHKTEVSLDIVISGNTKQQGIEAICELIEIDPQEVAYIGDSSGDIPGLKIVGQPFAPSNAAEEVKEHARVIDASVTDAVLWAYRNIIQENRRHLADAV